MSVGLAGTPAGVEGPMTLHIPQQKLLFVLGKGGVGRSTVAAALAGAFAQRGETCLLVQWAVHDALSAQFGAVPHLSHEARRVADRVSCMNFDADEAMREYFVDHLGFKLLHTLVIENRHVQRLIEAAPGIQELFFLGRLFWLVRLAQKERGWSYDRVIVDAPAMGHGVSLFRIAPAIASMGMAGPLAAECERVTELLHDKATVGTVVVTIPEELPVEETIEFLPQITMELKSPPLFAVLNRSFVTPFPEDEVRDVMGVLGSDTARAACAILATDLRKREAFAEQLNSTLVDLGVPLVRIVDAHLLTDRLTPQGVHMMAREALLRQWVPTPGAVEQGAP